MGWDGQWTKAWHCAFDDAKARVYVGDDGDDAVRRCSNGDEVDHGILRSAQSGKTAAYASGVVGGATCCWDRLVRERLDSSPREKPTAAD
jgi:hypothetical protein